jgi:hypothetical protein
MLDMKRTSSKIARMILQVTKYTACLPDVVKPLCYLTTAPPPNQSAFLDPRPQPIVSSEEATAFLRLQSAMVRHERNHDDHVMVVASWSQMEEA